MLISPAKTRTGAEDAALAALLVGLALIPRMVLWKLRGYGLFNADHAIIGLMAKHLLAGKPMVYYYGQGYMGSLEAFVCALIFLIRGISIYSVELAPLTVFIVFLVINYYFLMDLYGREIGLTTSLLYSPFLPPPFHA